LNVPHIVVVSPLFLTYTQLILMSFNNKRSNKCEFISEIYQSFTTISYLTIFLSIVLGWFGIRKNFCHFLFDICPCFEEYCNISYSLEVDEAPSRRRSEDEDDSEAQTTSKRRRTSPVTSKVNAKPVMPIISIDMPD